MMSTLRKFRHPQEILVIRGQGFDEVGRFIRHDYNLISHLRQMRIDGGDSHDPEMWWVEETPEFNFEQLVIGISNHLGGTDREFYIFSCWIAGKIRIYKHELEERNNRGGRNTVFYIALSKILDEMIAEGDEMPKSFYLFRDVDVNYTTVAMLDDEFGGAEAAIGFFFEESYVPAPGEPEPNVYSCILIEGSYEGGPSFTIPGPLNSCTTYFVWDRDEALDLVEFREFVKSHSGSNGYLQLCMTSRMSGYIACLVDLSTTLNAVFKLNELFHALYSLADIAFVFMLTNY